MSHSRPPILIVLGALGVVLGLAYMVWLVLWQRDHLFDLYTAAIGDSMAHSKLRPLTLAAPGFVFISLVTFLVELTLTLILFWTGLALMSFRPWSRWAAVFYSVCMIVIGVVHVLLLVFYLPPSSPGRLDLMPLLTHGGITLFAIVLCGTMFLPAVSAAYAGGGPVRAGHPAEADPEDRGPARRRGRRGDE